MLYDFLLIVCNINVSYFTGSPSITEHPSDTTIPVRTATTLMCLATTGGGTLMYSWESGSGSSWTPIRGINRRSYTTDTTLTIGEHMYRCRVSNEAGSVVSNSATVIVYGEYCPNR